MPHKVEVPKRIKNKTQRNIAFCKRKRALLKKAIELSVSCEQQMLLVIYDEHRQRLIQYSSSEDFNIKGAYEAQKVAKQPANIDKFERFSNEDFLRLEMTDFRSIRYKKKMLYDRELEFIEEFEDGAAAQGRLDELTKQPSVSGLKQTEGYFSESDLIEDTDSQGGNAAQSKGLWNHQIFRYRKGKTHHLPTSGDEEEEEIRRPRTRFQALRESPPSYQFELPTNRQPDHAEPQRQAAMASNLDAAAPGGPIVQPPPSSKPSWKILIEDRSASPLLQTQMKQPDSAAIAFGGGRPRLPPTKGFSSTNLQEPKAGEGLFDDILSGRRCKDLAPPQSGQQPSFKAAISTSSPLMKPSMALPNHSPEEKLKQPEQLEVKGDKFNIFGIASLLAVEPQTKATPILPPPYFVMAPSGPTPSIIIKGNTVNFHSLGANCNCTQDTSPSGGNLSIQSVIPNAPASKQPGADLTSLKSEMPFRRSVSDQDQAREVYSASAERRKTSTDKNEATISAEALQ